MGEISDHWSWWHRRSCRVSHGAGRKRCDVDRQNAHLECIQQKGLTLQTMWDENTKTIPVKASDMQHYKDRPDVILVCVKDIRWMEFTNLSVELQNRRRL